MILLHSIVTKLLATVPLQTFRSLTGFTTWRLGVTTQNVNKFWHLSFLNNDNYDVTPKMKFPGIVHELLQSITLLKCLLFEFFRFIVAHGRVEGQKWQMMLMIPKSFSNKYPTDSSWKSKLFLLAVDGLSKNLGAALETILW